MTGSKEQCLLSVETEIVSGEGFTLFDCRQFCNCQSLKEPQDSTDFHYRFATISISIT